MDSLFPHFGFGRRIAVPGSYRLCMATNHALPARRRPGSAWRPHARPRPSRPPHQCTLLPWAPENLPEPRLAPAPADPGQARMIRKPVVKTAADEPANRDVRLRFAHQTAVMRNPKQESGQHQTDRDLWIDRRPTVVRAIAIGDFPCSQLTSRTRSMRAKTCDRREPAAPGGRRRTAQVGRAAFASSSRDLTNSRNSIWYHQPRNEGFFISLMNCSCFAIRSECSSNVWSFIARIPSQKVSLALRELHLMSNSRASKIAQAGFGSF